MVQQPYYQSIVLIERRHRHFLELVKAELERRGIQDINNVQSLILYNIGSDELTVGELTARGYYLGSNVSYNVKKMVENGYLVQEIGRAHVCTPVTNAHLVCRLLLEKKNQTKTIKILHFRTPTSPHINYREINQLRSEPNKHDNN